MYRQTPPKKDEKKIEELSIDCYLRLRDMNKSLLLFPSFLFLLSITSYIPLNFSLSLM